jgi:hypothetical protein
MSTVWDVKSPTEIVERTWEVPTLADDSLASIVTVVAGVTKDSEELDGDLVTLTLSAGTADATATVDITATTANGLTITKKFYLPIRADGNKLAYTGLDICNYALRKVTGINASPSAAEIDDALERLSGRLAGWAGEGADLSAKLPVASTDILYVPDWSIEAIKAVLTADLHDFYGVPQTRVVAMDAQRGMARIKFNCLPEDREGADYY